MASPGAEGAPPRRLRRTRALGSGAWQTGRWVRDRFRPSTDPPWLEQLLDGDDDGRETRESTLEIHHHWFAHARAALYRAVAVLSVVAGALGVPRTVEGTILLAAVLLSVAFTLAARGRRLPVDPDVFSQGMRVGCLVAAIGLYAYATAGLLSVEDPSGLLLLLAPVAAVRGEWLWQATSSDVLFVTTKRVFKVNSFLSKTMGAMPLRGLVDLTVHQPVLGRVLGYGHLTFESAAQRQGLDKFHFVGDPLGVSKQIQARAYGGGPAGGSGGRGGGGPDDRSRRAGGPHHGDDGGDGVSDVSVPWSRAPLHDEPVVEHATGPVLDPRTTHREEGTSARRGERIRTLSEIVPREHRPPRDPRRPRPWPWSRDA
ncbi:PH domain-containing protein [Nocardioides sp. HDW12B]|uniref:PH domain-containing protein n=1 Tax=Nocardioides sp. HDW12B TaxID=2714939 RepID=UPI00140D1131|nr:PH domain-containing protein [Nocardioides sp. HDW12B]QIK67082.1 PH domain-containing protein [Nocardioides sp. HDW12B]